MQLSLAKDIYMPDYEGEKSKSPSFCHTLTLALC